MIPISEQNQSDEDIQSAVVRVDNIESETSKHDDPYAKLTAHNGQTFSAWDEYYEQVKRHHDDLQGSWCKLLYVENGDYRNLRGFTELDESEIPDEDEIEEDPLAGVSREERIRKAAMWKSAAATVDEQNFQDPEAVAYDTAAIAKKMDEQFVDWLAGGDDR